MATAPSTFSNMGRSAAGSMLSREDRQLRRDRIVAAAVIGVFVALMALTVWLASLPGGTAPDSGIWLLP